MMSPQPDDLRQARAVLTYLAEPADPILGALLQVTGPCEILDAIRTGALPATLSQQLGAAHQARIGPALERWRWRMAAMPAMPAMPRLDLFAAQGVCLLCPGDPGWPDQVDGLGLTRPCALWVRGTQDLRDLCHQAVAVVGSRAATAYGRHVSAEITTGLAAGGWTVVSGGAYGIDAAAHRAALAGGGRTVAVLACGPDHAYPREHSSLFDEVAARGAVVSEYPPGTLPDRRRFLARNRIIAALTCGTVVVEAAQRGGAMVTALQAGEIGRPVMAVPGPVTSAMSAGCHALIRAGQAVVVTSAAEVSSCLARCAGPGDGPRSG